MPNVLIVSFAFPPYNRIGGRRWHKFGIELCKHGYEVHLMAAEPLKSLSHQQVEVPDSFHVTRLDPRYPEALREFKHTLSWKVNYRLQESRLKQHQGNYFDYSLQWDHYFETLIPDYIKRHSIKQVIVCGGPFRYFFYARKLRDLSVKVILDYRDPWTAKKGFFEHNRQRQQYEQQLEREAIAAADVLITPSRDIFEGMAKAGLATQEELEQKTQVIHNGLDPDDGFCAVSDQEFIRSKSDPSEIRMLYYGGIHCDLEYFRTFLSGVQKATQELGLKTTVDFYGNENQDYNDAVRACDPEIFHIHGKINGQEFLKLSEQTDFFLYFKPVGRLPNTFAVKFYDYLRGGRLQLVTTAPQGDVRGFFETSNTGVLLNPEVMEAQVMDILQQRKERTLYCQPTEELLDQNSLSGQTEKIIELLT